jgi:hypothetical protein
MDDAPTARESLRYLAALEGLGNLDADTIRKMIDSLINSGYYLDSFLDVLDSSSHPTMQEVRPAFVDLLERHGIAVPGREEAIWQLIEYHMRKISSGAVDPVEGLNRWYFDVYPCYDFHARTTKYLGDSHGIEGLLAWYWGADDLQRGPNEISVNGKYGDAAWVELRNEIRNEATQWLAKTARKRAANDAEAS